ncbi:MAG: patatin-like phospholipase family protein, partial [Pseudobdellovibrio sp.]
MAKNAIKLIFAALVISGCATTNHDSATAPGSAVKPEKPKNQTVYNDKDTKKDAANSVPSPLMIPPAETNANLLGLTPALTPPPAAAPTQVEAAPSASDLKGVTRIGLIFSGGGAKAWGHIGVLKQIENEKWPVRAVAGIEWGAAVAGVYAHQLSANETEWEMLKVKDFEDPEQSSEVLFSNRSVSDLKVPFVCPSLNIVKQEMYLLNRGQLSKLVPFCLPSLPIAKPYKQSVAVLDNIQALAQHLRATGVKRVILIDVMSTKNDRAFARDNLSAENII